MGSEFKDIRSLANINHFKIIKFHWTINACFESKTLRCRTLQTYQCIKKKNNHLVLDTKDITVQQVQVNGTEAPYKLGACVESLGQPLEISLPSHLCDASSSTFEVEIVYDTSPCASAIQWLSPEQTLGKKQPYMYTQCQRLHARSLLPCQDSPGCKFTFTAEVSVPRDMVVLMSTVKGDEAISNDSTNVGDDQQKGRKLCLFQQDVPMSAYLLAIAIGPLVSRELGPRSRVWCESELADACAYEFARVEETLQITESLLGPYVWKVYDMLVLPPSFPPAGMENACLTFLTPTIVTGDRSLTNVMVHEIIHGWTGNLVTNRKWEDFWLNEGFTRFIEAKVEGLRDGEAVRQFKMLNGWNSLVGATDKSTALVPDLSSIKVGNASSPVPYEKGAAFLYYIESLVGGPALFDPFLKAYIERFKYKSIETDDFKMFLLEYYADAETRLDEIDWNCWLYGTGMPPVDVVELYDKSVLEDCHELCEKWKHASLEEIQHFPPSEYTSLPTRKRIYFLSKLYLERPSLDRDQVKKMSELYDIMSSNVCSVKYPFFRMCVRARWMEALPHVVRFLREQGRTKFIRKLYKELYDHSETKELAVKTFKECRHLYHPIAARKVAADLDLLCD